MNHIADLFFHAHLSQGKKKGARKQSQKSSSHQNRQHTTNNSRLISEVKKGDRVEVEGAGSKGRMQSSYTQEIQVKKKRKARRFREHGIVTAETVATFRDLHGLGKWGMRSSLTPMLECDERLERERVCKGSRGFYGAEVEKNALLKEDTDGGSSEEERSESERSSLDSFHGQANTVEGARFSCDDTESDLTEETTSDEEELESSEEKDSETSVEQSSESDSDDSGGSKVSVDNLSHNGHFESARQWPTRSSSLKWKKDDLSYQRPAGTDQSKSRANTLRPAISPLFHESRRSSVPLRPKWPIRTSSMSPLKTVVVRKGGLDRHKTRRGKVAHAQQSIGRPGLGIQRILAEDSGEIEAVATNKIVYETNNGTIGLALTTSERVSRNRHSLEQDAIPRIEKYPDDWPLKSAVKASFSSTKSSGLGFGQHFRDKEGKEKCAKRAVHVGYLCEFESLEKMRGEKWIERHAKRWRRERGGLEIELVGEKKREERVR